MEATDGDLAERFAQFARAFRTGAPLYARIAERVRHEPEILSAMSAAPPTQRIPVLLFAAVHHLVLGEPGHPLASHYPSLNPDNGSSTATSTAASTATSTGTSTGSTSDPADEFVSFVVSRLDAVTEILRTRTVQTNEVGRCSWLLFPCALLDDEVGPLARVDVGSSAGLTLLFPDISIDFGPAGVSGGSADLVLHCELRNGPPVPIASPRLVWSMGLDPRPVDLRDRDAVRWLEACLWPENTDRLRRFRRAVEAARSRGISVERGDALSDLALAVERAREHGHPVVTTTWVLNYLSADERMAFVAELDRLGSRFDLSWVIAESPLETPELPVPTTGDEDITVLSLVTWRGGRRAVRRLATLHPHGNWINWDAREPT